MHLKNPRSSSNYIKLFDFVSSQRMPDDAAIVKRFAGQPFTRQLHVAKNYLYESILRSLRDYHAKDCKEDEIIELIRDISVLYNRQLFDACSHKLRKASKIADQYEFFSYKLILLGWERRLLIDSNRRNGVAVHPSTIQNEEKEVLAKLEHLATCRQLAVELNNSAPTPNEKKYNRLRAIANISPGQNTSFQSEVLQSHSRFALFSLEGKVREAEQENARLIKHMQQRPDRLREDLTSYLTVLGNQIGLLLQARRYADIPEFLSMLRNAPDKYDMKGSMEQRIRLNLRSFNIELELLRDAKDFEKAFKMISQIQAFLEENKRYVSEKYLHLFHFQMGQIYFSSQKHALALKMIDPLLRTGSARPDLGTYARFIFLMIHFELQNMRLLAYALESVRRFLRKRGGIQSFEKKLLSFFSSACKNPYGEHQTDLHRLKTSLFNGISPQKQHQISDYIDFSSWIEAQIIA